MERMNICVVATKVLSLCFVVLILPSCFHRVRVSTNTYVDMGKLPYGFVKGSSFCVASIKNDQPLLSKEIAYKIEKILKNSDYIIKDQNKADYVLAFDYGVTSEKGTRIVPIYAPAITQTISGSVYGAIRNCASYQQQSTTSGPVTYFQQEYVYYVRSLSFQVYDASLYRNSRKEEQIWYGAVANNSESGDLREAMDYLLAGIFSYFGKNTKTSVEKIFGFFDEDIDDFRKIYSK